MTAALVVLSFIPSIFQYVSPPPDENPFFMSQPLPTIEESLKMAIAAFVGAYFARVPFVLTTIVYYAGLTVFVFYLLTLIAEPIEPVSMFEVTARSAIGTGIGLIVAVLGAELGYQLSNARFRNSPKAM